MPPTAKRNASLVLFDVNTRPEFLERSRQCLLSICATKWFRQSNDCTQLILLNTAKTNNSVASKFGKCLHISEATDVINYDPNLVAPHIKDVETAKGDWVLGLTVALEAIRKNYYGNKCVMSIQLLFITDFSFDIKVKEQCVQYVIEQLKLMDVYLFIIGPEVQIPEYLVTYNDIAEWSKHMLLIGNIEKNSNLVIARDIVKNCKGVMCDLQIGEQLFHTYVNRWGLQPWNVPLTIGSGLTLSCSTVRFLRKQSGPKIKAITEGAAPNVWKWHMAEDVNEEVPYDNVIGGFFKHNKFVPLPRDVEQDFKVEGERSFKIVGFTNTSNIPEFYMRGDGACYVENNGSKLFDLLLNTLAEQEKCAIARRVTMKNCRPKLVALLPVITERKFLLFELPYKEAINASFKEQDINQATNLDKTQDPAIEEVYNYLKQLDITDPNNRNKYNSVKWPLSAMLMDDMRLNCVDKRCLEKYLDEDAEITSKPEIPLSCFVEDVQRLKQFIPAAETKD